MAGTAKSTDMIVARFRKCRDLVSEDKVLIKNKAKVPGGVSFSQRGVAYLRNSVLEELRLAVIQEETCCTAFREWYCSGN